MRDFMGLVLVCFFAAGCRAKPGGLEIRDAWVRPAKAGMNSAAYLTIENHGDQDTLLAARAANTEQAELHRSIMDNDGVMQMQQKPSVTIPARDKVIFEPGGLHIMLYSVSQDLIDGDIVQLKLTFEKAGELLINVPVQSP